MEELIKQFTEGLVQKIREEVKALPTASLKVEADDIELELRQELDETGVQRLRQHLINEEIALLNYQAKSFIVKNTAEVVRQRLETQFRG